MQSGLTSEETSDAPVGIEIVGSFIQAHHHGDFVGL